MSLSSFSAQDKHRAGLQQPKPPKVSKPYIVEPYTPKQQQWERADHPLNQFKGDEVEKLYWQISEVAEIMDTAPSLVRFYDETFSLHFKKNRKGNRVFTKEDIERLTVIVKLGQRFKLEQVKEYLKLGIEGRVLKALEELEGV